MAVEYLDIDGLVQTGRFRHAVRTNGGSTVYLSGQVPLDEQGNCVGVGDFDAQVHQVYRGLHAGAICAPARDPRRVPGRHPAVSDGARRHGAGAAGV